MNRITIIYMGEGREPGGKGEEGGVRRVREGKGE